LERWEHEFSVLLNPLFIHFSSYTFTYSLKNIHVHHHGGIGLKMTQYNIEKKKIMFHLLQTSSYKQQFYFYFFQSNVVFHISIVKAINNARKTTHQGVSHMGSSKENNTNKMGGVSFSNEVHFHLINPSCVKCTTKP
jgi:hypothetical protein